MSEGMGELVLIPPYVKYLTELAKKDPISFWEKIAIENMKYIYWKKTWDKTFEWGKNGEPYKWFIGGITNTEYSHIDFQIEKGYGNKAVYIYENPEIGVSKTYTFAQYKNIVDKYASAMRGMGVKKGDRVLTYMPTRPESVAILHAAARIGAIHSSVYAGFSAKALADRIDGVEAEWIFVQDYNLRRGKVSNLKQVVDDSLKLVKTKVKKVVVLKSGYFNQDVNMEKGRDIYWEEFLDFSKSGSSEVEWMESNEPVFITPTSGTTAKPKPVVHKHGSFQNHVVTMARWIYDLKPTDTWFITSDVGWQAGISYMVWGVPIFGIPSILYDGVPDYPKPDMWWEVIERNKVTKVWFSPTAIRLLMKYGTDYAKKHDLSSLEVVFSAGEPLNPTPLKWLMYDVFENRVPVIDHYWQTETAGPIVGNTYGIKMLPIKIGSAGIPLPGIIGEVVDENTGKPVKPGEKGVLVIKHPFPGFTSELWKDQDRYWKSYWEANPNLKGMIYTGDAATIDEHGYIWFMGRADDVIKISAHRIGTFELESALVSHPAVAEAAVVGVPDPVRGEVAMGFVILKEGYKPSEELKNELIEHAKKTFGPIAVFKGIEIVKALPKTRSGKIMRRVIRAVYLDQPMGDISTLEDEASVEEIKKAVEEFKKEIK
ncbi:MAG: acetate--CoA ligase [Caldisphaera sp.]|uniref:acetate--CoA ligase n=1 Tax=Caldisphaera sp. TaxID=2060322 RepID=UPI0025BE81E2|nr:acetate--CoA ligase [Caldisphaera sp.]